jgi:hypothetical protein
MTNLPAIHSDGFDHFDDRIEGQDTAPRGGGVTFLSFGLDGIWRAGPDKTQMSGVVLVISSLERRAVRREMMDGKPRQAEVLVIGPGERFPDVAAWNASLPDAEKLPGFSGGLEGPWHTDTRSLC